VRNSADFRRNPRLWVFPPSLSSAKAHLCLRLSAVWPFAEVRVIDIFGDCYDPTFCRLNPDMTVPVLEAEDKVVTGARTIAGFLQERYAGDGDGRAVLAGRSAELERFKALADRWDEDLYALSGGRRPSGTRLADRLRLARLRQQCLSIVEDEASSSEDDGTEDDFSPSGSPPSSSPQASRPDNRELQDAYERKIAELQHREEFAGRQSEEDWRSCIMHNRRILNSIWKSADELLQRSGAQDGFLLSSELTSADAFFVPIMCQMQVLRPSDFRRQLKHYPAVRGYWARVQQQEEAQVVHGLRSWGLAQPLLLKRMLPCQLLGVRCGCIVAPDLPEEVEERIRKLQNEMQMRQG